VVNCFIYPTTALGTRTAKARMITGQEAFGLGCTSSSNSCPISSHAMSFFFSNPGLF